MNTKFRARSLLATVLLPALMGAGCATAIPNPKIVFSNASINGQPVRAILDTGAGGGAFLTDAAAPGLGVRFTPTPNEAATAPAIGLSNPLNLTINAESITTPIAMINNPGFGFDLLIGWSAVRDNILVFDGATRTVNTVAELPEETSGWLKLKISSAAQDQLLLEVPLSDGAIGTIELDTGDPGGVTLPEAQWKQWSAAHPHTDLDTLGETYLETGVMHVVPVAQAEKIELGPLALTDVSVHEAGDVTVYGNAGDNFMGSFGLGAIERMDVVVDGKNGVAYLRPKPAPGTGATDAKSVTSDPTTAKQDWTVTGPMRLKSDAFVLAAAEYKLNIDDYDGAIADCSHAIELDQHNVYAWTLRATAKQDKQDFDGAIADCDQALELDPKNDMASLLRSVALESKDDKGSTQPATAAAPPSGAASGMLTMISMIKRLPSEMNNGDYDAAIADIDSLIASEPTSSPDLYTMRGAAWEGKGDADRALASFNQAIKLGPKSSFAYLERGGAWQIKGDFAHALADFNKSLELQKDEDPTPRLLRELLLLRLNRPAKDFAASVAGWNDGWKKTLGQYLVGALDDTAVLTAAEKSSDMLASFRQCEAYYYFGIMRLLKGDMIGARTFSKNVWREI